MDWTITIHYAMLSKWRSRSTRGNHTHYINILVCILLIYIHSFYLSIDSFHHLFIHPLVAVHLCISYICPFIPSVYPFILSIYLSILSAYLSIYPFIASIYLSVHLHVCIYLSILSAYLFIYPFIAFIYAFRPSIYLSFYMYVFIYLSILFLYLSINSLVDSLQDWNASDDFSDGISYTTTSTSVHSASWSLLISSWWHRK